MSIRHRVLATAGVTALVAAPFTLASGAATATPAVDPTVTDLGNGISEIVYSVAGDHTFTAPAGITKVSAILVGGGAGGGVLGDSTGFAAYAGGGGGVVYVDSVDVSSPVTFTVGEGTLDPTAGGDTTLGSNTAGGGGESYLGNSGSPQENTFTVGYDVAPFYWTSGGGAGGDGNSDCSSGPGLTPSAAANNPTLFPALLGEPEYGKGGSCSGVSINPVSIAAPGKGGDVYTDGSGNPLADAGADGAVIFRWKSALPDTGMNVQPWLIGAGAAAVAAGLLFASNMLRARRRGRHSA